MPVSPIERKRQRDQMLLSAALTAVGVFAAHKFGLTRDLVAYLNEAPTQFTPNNISRYTSAFLLQGARVGKQELSQVFKDYGVKDFRGYFQRKLWQEGMPVGMRKAWAKTLHHTRSIVESGDAELYSPSVLRDLTSLLYYQREHGLNPRESEIIVNQIRSKLGRASRQKTATWTLGGGLFRPVPPKGDLRYLELGDIFALPETHYIRKTLDADRRIWDLVRRTPALHEVMLDPRVYINQATGTISDFRGGAQVGRLFNEWIGSHFQVPFVGFNPLAVLLNPVRNRAEANFFEYLTPTRIQRTRTLSALIPADTRGRVFRFGHELMNIENGTLKPIYDPVTKRPLEVVPEFGTQSSITSLIHPLRLNASDTLYNTRQRGGWVRNFLGSFRSTNEWLGTMPKGVVNRIPGTRSMHPLDLIDDFIEQGLPGWQGKDVSDVERRIYSRLSNYTFALNDRPIVGRIADELRNLVGSRFGVDPTDIVGDLTNDAGIKRFMLSLEQRAPGFLGEMSAGHGIARDLFEGVLFGDPQFTGHAINPKGLGLSAFRISDIDMARREFQRAALAQIRSSPGGLQILDDIYASASNKFEIENLRRMHLMNTMGAHTRGAIGVEGDQGMGSALARMNRAELSALRAEVKRVSDAYIPFGGIGQSIADENRFLAMGGKTAEFNRLEYLRRPITPNRIFEIVQSNRERIANGELPEAIVPSIVSMFTQFAPTTVQDATSWSKISLNYFLNRVFRMAELVPGLGLHESAYRAGPWNTLREFGLYRALPIAAAVWGFQVADELGEDRTGYSVKDESLRAILNSRVAMAGIRDRLGLTGLTKEIERTFPGIEQVFSTLQQIPGIGDVGLNLFTDKSAPELLKHYQSGYDEIRRGRWWMFSGTPWTGGGVEAYVPNIWWRTTSNYMMDDQEKWKRLNPLNAVFDPYWFEKAHYWDRPYPVSGNAFADDTVWGGILNPTVGRLIKPPVRMHAQDVNRAVAALNTYESGYQDQLLQRNGFIDLQGRAVEGINKTVNATTAITAMHAGRVGRGGSPGLGGWGGGLVDGTGGDLVSDWGQLGQDQALFADRSIADRPNALTKFEYVSREWMGLYGFTRQVMFGDVGIDTPHLQSAQRGYSTQERVWGLRIGGGPFPGFASAEVNEMVRRFFPNRQTQQMEFNPIPNRTAPSWLPGAGYFKNYTVGDFYLNHPMGQAVLPGYGFEQLYGRDLDKHLVASSLGKSRQEIIDYLLSADAQPLDAEGRRVTKLGDVLHKQISREFRERGVLIASEYEWEDPALQTRGFIDNLLRDPQTGNLVVEETKTVGNRRWNEIPLGGYREHLSQLNLYLYETRTPGGYLYYVNQDNPQQRMAFWHKFDPRMLETDIGRWQSAYSEIEQGVKNGLISPYETYKPFYRALALGLGGAHWSEQYDFWYKRAMEDASDKPDEQERLRELNEMVRNLRQKHRFYEYRFLGKKDPEGLGLFERGVGAAWEALLHSDNPLSNKFLRGRNAIETYEREVLYGKGFRSWERPWSDWVVPTADAVRSKGVAGGALVGAFTLSLFGRTPTAKVGAAVVGGLLGAAGGAEVTGWRTLHPGRAWIPPRVQTLRDIETYYDTIAYVKWMRLYDETGDEQYLNLARRTGFGVNPYDKSAGNWSRMYGALPFPDRDYFMSFVNEADPGRRRKILRYVQPTTRKILRARWFEDDQDHSHGILDQIRELFGKSHEFVEEHRHPMTELRDYFHDHHLPGPEWPGWKPGVNIDEYKYQSAVAAGVDAHELNLWNDTRRASSMHDTPTIDLWKPNLNDFQIAVLLNRYAAHGTRKLREVDSKTSRHKVRVNVNHNRDAANHYARYPDSGEGPGYRTDRHELRKSALGVK